MRGKLRGVGMLGLVVLYYLDRDGEMHGYMLRKRIIEASGVEIRESSLYDALRRLEKEGLVEASWSVVGGRLRRVYRITGKGRSILEQGLNEAKALLKPIICGGGDP